MKRLITTSSLALVLLLTACGGAGPASSAARGPDGSGETGTKTSSYTCPMHPHYISTDATGSCPICGMALVPSKVASPENDSKDGPLYYKNPMGLADTSPVPKKDSMGMDYIPVYAEAATGRGVVVPSEMLQTMGVRTARAGLASFGRTVRAYGNVQSNERLESTSTSRLEGWIESLTVRAEGDPVSRGALLYRVYSPDLIAAQKDYLASAKIGNDARIASVRQRLRSLGMQNATIDQLARTGALIERIPVYAETAGIVKSLDVREGDYVKPGTPVLRLQSYSDVWIIASVAEQDLPYIDAGMAASLSVPSAPESAVAGKVDYIYPTIDPKTRTAQVRILVDNASGALRPGAYADVSFDLDGSERLAVPGEAVLRDSSGAHVIVALGDGRFDARAVQTGVSARGLTEIVNGLQPGDLVVASGQFMLDSEVNLREGLAKLSQPDAMQSPDDPLDRLVTDPATLAEIDHLTDMALYFHEALTKGYTIKPDFVAPAIRAGETLGARFGGTRLAPVLAGAVTALKSASLTNDKDTTRKALDDLMIALEPWLLNGAPAHYRTAGLSFFREAGTGRAWVQEAASPANPYGTAAAEKVEWPDRMSMDMTGMAETPQ